jgi:hypothetical protein
MKRALIVLMLSLLCAMAHADTTYTTTTVTITTAQQDAEEMARTGVLRHCGRANGRREGIGSGMSRAEAIRNCCYWGQWVPVEIGAAQGPRGRWYAVVRYSAQPVAR